jgi:hypothetical protein
MIISIFLLNIIISIFLLNISNFADYGGRIYSIYLKDATLGMLHTLAYI